ncbi:hypothetical protein WOLCODRAFT_154674 [Wolfiporia cocos MD-104 SS10]|uniref:Autophagy-related protein 14 n=1 Tax=Wolfiporia cocos (strain MD-104) TaxID=742152 RepID=A0A2H3K854_WOLCO|nr:hypothetical protein WOLCODRAFT_154674 [Wolfiporia cocos MD-104 SS10]
MECQNCELKQRQFYCENCLKQHLLSLRIQTTRVAADRDAHIASAQRSLALVVDPARVRRADLNGTQERVEEILGALDELRKNNENMRDKVRSMRSALVARRRTLAIADSFFHYSTVSSSSIPTSSSPPYAHTPSIPGSFPHAPSSPPVPSHPLRPLTHRRGSSTNSVAAHTSVPSSSSAASVPRTPTTSRSGLPYTLAAPSGLHAYAQRVGMPGAQYPPNERGGDVLARQIDEATYRLTTLSDTLARARSGLVQELVEVFSVVEVGGRPPVGGKAGTKGEWTIGGLVLPVLGDMRRYPPDHINAVLTHTLHFLSLLAFYLGIKLPFGVIWSRSSTPPSSSSSPDRGLLGVGVPWIGAIKGGENGGWARWSTKQPLHVSSSPPATTSTNSQGTPSTSRPSTQTNSPKRLTARPSATRARTLSASLADSQLDDAPAPSPAAASAQSSSFTTALAMLLYDVCYLAHTQGVDVPLAQAGEVLGNLWAVCCSSELGRRSHATQPLLPAPTPSTFALDFAQLLQATAATPARPRARGTGGKERQHTERIVEEDEGWDLVDAE